MLLTSPVEDKRKFVEEEVLKAISINRITFLNFSQKKILNENIDSSYELSLLSIEEIEKIVGKKHNNRIIWDGKENLRRAQIALHYCRVMDIKILHYSEVEYPELLRQICDPPYILFCKGNISILTKGTSVSVVGTRQITPNGKKAARQFAYDACVNGCNVISGLANGVDGYAHQGVIDAYFDRLEKGMDINQLGKTIAVLPSGIDQIVPGSHKKMAMQILQSGGLLISEYEPKMNMADWHFVGRNRIIAGLSPSTVVIEAPSGSGALLTADFALEYNREVMFHQAVFGDLAVQIADSVKRELEIEYATGKISRTKMENRPEKYIEAGAPVIKDYNDYCRCLVELPGTRNNQPIQGTLFFEQG